MGLVEGWLLAKPGRIADINNITNAERAEAETQTLYAIKAAPLISGADKRRYGGLNNDLGNNYLLGSDQYPDWLVYRSKLPLTFFCLGVEE